MKKTNSIMLTLTMCSVIQACTSSSDMGPSSGDIDASQAIVPDITQPVPDNGAVTGNPTASGGPAIVPDITQPEPDTGAATESPTASGGDDTTENPTTASGGENVAVPDEATMQQLVANASSVNCDAPAADFQSTMLAVINESRLSARMCGTGSHPAVNTLTWNDDLTSAANVHANDMVTFNFFDHDGSDGLSVANRADSAGYIWRAIGENIAAGQTEIAEVHQGWLDSPGHCRNIMNALYSEVGASCVVSDNNDFRSYWVVVFGDQP